MRISFIIGLIFAILCVISAFAGIWSNTIESVKFVNTAVLCGVLASCSLFPSFVVFMEKVNK